MRKKPQRSVVKSPPLLSRPSARTAQRIADEVVWLFDQNAIERSPYNASLYRAAAEYKKARGY